LIGHQFLFKTDSDGEISFLLFERRKCGRNTCARISLIAIFWAKERAGFGAGNTDSLRRRKVVLLSNAYYNHNNQGL
jgi:hypothetical protein